MRSRPDVFHPILHVNYNKLDLPNKEMKPPDLYIVGTRLNILSLEQSLSPWALAKQSHTVMDRKDCFVAPLLTMTE